jgi:hypothetical protein
MGLSRHGLLTPSTTKNSQILPIHHHRHLIMTFSPQTTVSDQDRSFDLGLSLPDPLTELLDDTRHKDRKRMSSGGRAFRPMANKFRASHCEHSLPCSHMWTSQTNSRLKPRSPHLSASGPLQWVKNSRGCDSESSRPQSDIRSVCSMRRLNMKIVDPQKGPSNTRSDRTPPNRSFIFFAFQEQRQYCRHGQRRWGESPVREETSVLAHETQDIL